MAIKGSASSTGIPNSGYEGQRAYAWEHSCNPSVFRCRENIFTNGYWVANGLYPDSYCPLIDTDTWCNGGTGGQGNTGGGSGGGDGGNSGGIFGGSAGGLFPWGLGNILGTDSTDFIKKTLAVLALLIAALLLFMFLKRKK